MKFKLVAKTVGLMSAGILVLCAGLVWIYYEHNLNLQASPALQGLPSGGILVASGGVESNDVDAKQTHKSGAEKSIAEIEKAIFTVGSLRGAQLDGSWGGIGADKRLIPSSQLRDRFEQIFITQGDISIEDMRRLVAAYSERDLGSDGSAEVLKIWDRFIKLKSEKVDTRLGNTFDTRNPDHLTTLLQSHQLSRRQNLGPEWADAFYKEDDALAQATIDRMRSGKPPAASGLDVSKELMSASPTGVSASQWHDKRVAAFGAEAAQRLALEDQAQQKWTDRLDAARGVVDRLQNSPELSQQQKSNAIDQWLAQNYSGTELLRARSLLLK